MCSRVIFTMHYLSKRITYKWLMVSSCTLYNVHSTYIIRHIIMYRALFRMCLCVSVCFFVFHSSTLSFAELYSLFVKLNAYANEHANEKSKPKNFSPVVLSSKHLLICRFRICIFYREYFWIYLFSKLKYVFIHVHKFIRTTEKYPCGIWNMRIVLFFSSSFFPFILTSLPFSFIFFENSFHCLSPI